MANPLGNVEMHRVYDKCGYAYVINNIKAAYFYKTEILQKSEKNNVLWYCQMNSCKYNKNLKHLCTLFFGGHNISNTLSKTTSSLKREASWGRNNKRRVMIKVLGDWMELKQKLRALQMFLWSRAALGAQTISQGEFKPNSVELNNPLRTQKIGCTN